MPWLIAAFGCAVPLEGNPALEYTQTESVFLARRWVEEHAILALLIHL